MSHPAYPIYWHRVLFPEEEETKPFDGENSWHSDVQYQVHLKATFETFTNCVIKLSILEMLSKWPSMKAFDLQSGWELLQVPLAHQWQISSWILQPGNQTVDFLESDYSRKLKIFPVFPLFTFGSLNMLKIHSCPETNATQHFYHHLLCVHHC